MERINCRGGESAIRLVSLFNPIHHPAEQLTTLEEYMNNGIDVRERDRKKFVEYILLPSMEDVSGRHWSSGGRGKMNFTGSTHSFQSSSLLFGNWQPLCGRGG